MVFDPVDAAAGATVPASISALLLLGTLRSDTTYCSSGGGDVRGRRMPGRGLLAEVQEEQRLVDAALEDRHAQLHALLNHLAALKACFAGQLRGREVDCHFDCPPIEVCALTCKVPGGSDGYNGDPSIRDKHSATPVWGRALTNKVSDGPSTATIYGARPGTVSSSVPAY